MLRFVLALVAVLTPAVAAAESCIDDGKPYDPDVLRARIEVLASKELDGRLAGSDHDLEARRILKARMACLGLGPFEQPFVYGDTHTANLVGIIQGASSDEIVIVGAHYDHLGDGHLGANDNASGT